ncbi:MAG: signal peptidase I [Rivularia sp. (in: cyanobacteria)]
MSNKEPWLAVNLSRLLPGIGQIYSGKRLKGYIILVSYFFFMGLGISLMISSDGNLLVGSAILITALTILPIWNMFDAYYSAKNRNSYEFETERKQNKDAWLAVFLSGLVPGLGYVYLKKWVLTTTFIGYYSFLTVVTFNSPIFLVFVFFLQFIVSPIVLYHVYVSTPVRRERSQRTIRRFVGIWFILNLFLLIGTRTFIFQPNVVAGTGMPPTLQNKDRFIVNKLIYKFRLPERGDMVLYSRTEPQDDMEGDWFTFVLGLPGDTIQIKEEQVYINNQLLNDTTDIEFLLDEFKEYGWNNPQVIPPNYFIVRTISNEENKFGLSIIQRENIIGQITMRLHPFDRVGLVEEQENKPD